MDDNLVMFSSVTKAMRARQLLVNYNIFSSIVRTPLNIKVKSKSCGYSLYVPRNIDNALEILRNGQIAVIGTAFVGKK